MTDPDDPLRGLDPYPRERIDGLHPERAELLEEIVSTPGPSKASTPSKVLLAIGVAAALVIVGGGGWLLGNAGSDDGSGDRLAAAGTTSSAPSTSSTAPSTSGSSAPDSSAPSSTAPTAPGTRATPTDRTRLKVLRGKACNRLDTVSLRRVLRMQSHRVTQPRTGRGRYYLVLRNGSCVLRVDRGH